MRNSYVDLDTSLIEPTVRRNKDSNSKYLITGSVHKVLINVKDRRGYSEQLVFLIFVSISIWKITSAVNALKKEIIVLKSNLFS